MQIFSKLCVCVLTKSGSFAIWSLRWGANLLHHTVNVHRLTCSEQDCLDPEDKSLNDIAEAARLTDSLHQ